MKHNYDSSHMYRNAPMMHTNHCVSSASIARTTTRRWIARALISSTIFASALFTSLASQSPLAIAQGFEAGTESLEDTRVHWPRLDFVIPFNVDVTGQAPREIQLEYSEDSGTSWNLYSRSDVRSKQFQFEAPQEGEYQFRLKTLDSRGRSFDNPGEPLVVVVDTTKPTAELILDIDPRGMMHAEFNIRDAALDPASVQLSYHTESITQSREIPFELLRGQRPGQWIGTGAWNIPESTKLLSVRLTARDKAGNAVEVTRLPQLPRSAAVSTGLQLASGKRGDAREPRFASANPNAPIGSGLAQHDQPDALPKVQVLNGPGAKPPSGMDAKLTNQLVERQQEMIKQLIDQQESSNQLLAMERQNRIVNEIRANDPNKGTSSISPEAFNTKRSTADRSGVELSGQPTGMADSRSNRIPMREMTDQEVEQATAPNPISFASKRGEQSLLSKESAELLGAGDPPPADMQVSPTRIPGQTTFQRDIKPLYSNSKMFSLDYNIENDMDTAVSAVELWGTTDQGQTWELWGQDPDRTTPFDIQVETEGLFGFRMIIVGSNGLASNRPRNGDNADAWILVDTQVPQARLVSALYGKGSEAGSMVIEYKATDDYFSDRPIGLAYSESPDGPWTNIATGVRNNGRYVWPADPTLPPTIYLRIEAHDAAGNLATHRLEFPIDVQGLAPRGRIQGFRPIK